MKQLSTVLVLLVIGVLASAAPGKPRPQIMGVALSMTRSDAQARLQSLGSLEKEERKNQQVWSIKDPRISHLLVGYDGDDRVRYVTAIARAGGPRMSYQEVVDVKRARQMHDQANYKFTWEIEARKGQFGYVIIARGRDRQYLDSYSVKKSDQEEID